MDNTEVSQPITPSFEPFSGPHLAELRNRAGFTQESLSYASGVHKGTIKAIEGGITKRPTTYVLGALGKSLGVFLYAVWPE